MAFSVSSLASIRAARQSLNPALVRSRNSFTSWAGICTAGCCVLILLSYLDFVDLVLQNPLLGQFSQFFTERPAPSRPGRATGISHPGSLALFFVRRHGGLGAFYLRFRAFHEVAFLLLVLFVRAGIHILDTFDERLIFGRLLLRYLRLLVGVSPFGYGIR